MDFFRSDNIREAFHYIQNINFRFNDNLLYLYVVAICLAIDIIISTQKDNKYFYLMMTGFTLALLHQHLNLSLYILNFNMKKYFKNFILLLISF